MSEPRFDVSMCQRMDDGSYLLPKFVADVDYFDVKRGLPIWSIGRHRLSKRVFAATDGRYYMDRFFECLWLR